MTPRRRARAARLGPQPAAFIIVTGISGAGKSQALRALEDLGYYCVDNLPLSLIPTFADLILTARDSRRRAAVVVDVREGRALVRLPALYRRLKLRFGRRVRLVFLEASDTALLRRFSETRRPHPLGTGRSLVEGIGEERRLLLPIRQLADQVVDTTRLNVHELRRRILAAIGGAGRMAPLVVTLLSFSFRRGVPADADLVLDVRFLPNPHFVAALRPWSGREARVARYVLRAPATGRFLRLTIALLRFLVPHYIKEGKTYLTIGIGCTGGRHRSVAIAEAIARRLKGIRGIQLHVRHRDVAAD